VDCKSYTYIKNRSKKRENNSPSFLLGRRQNVYSGDNRSLCIIPQYFRFFDNSDFSRYLSPSHVYSSVFLVVFLTMSIIFPSSLLILVLTKYFLVLSSRPMLLVFLTILVYVRHGASTKRPSTKRPSLQNVLPTKRPSTKRPSTKCPSTKRPSVQNVLNIPQRSWDRYSISSCFPV
jgi:hypothetical protein